MCVCVCLCVCICVGWGIAACTPHRLTLCPPPPLSLSLSLSSPRRAFNKYDYDQDGFISVADLQHTFRAQGSDPSTAELVAWVRKRDLSGIGAVAFEDFAKTYLDSA